MHLSSTLRAVRTVTRKLMSGAMILAALTAQEAAAQSVDPPGAAVACVENAGAAEFACGNGSSTAGSGGNATALGRSALAKALDATAVGASAQTAFSGSAFGQNSQALGSSSTAVGKASQALATGSVAIGFNSFAGNPGTSSGSIAIGQSAGSPSRCREPPPSDRASFPSAAAALALRPPARTPSAWVRLAGPLLRCLSAGRTRSGRHHLG